jgi:hypothetical protein
MRQGAMSWVSAPVAPPPPGGFVGAVGNAVGAVVGGWQGQLISLAGQYAGAQLNAPPGAAPPPPAAPPAAGAPQPIAATPHGTATPDPAPPPTYPGAPPGFDYAAYLQAQTDKSMRYSAFYAQKYNEEHRDEMAWSSFWTAIWSGPQTSGSYGQDVGGVLKGMFVNPAVGAATGLYNLGYAALTDPVGLGKGVVNGVAQAIADPAGAFLGALTAVGDGFKTMEGVGSAYTGAAGHCV